MTGAGSGELAFAKETTFTGSLDTGADSTVDYWHFGRNPTLTELDLQRQLQRMRDAGAVEAVNSLAGNVEGAIGVEAVISNDVQADVHDIVFNDGSGSSFSTGAANSARVFVGLDYIGGTVERELKGCIPLSYRVSYQQGQPTTFRLRMAYADEVQNTSITPSSINKATDGSEVPHHGTTLTIDGTNTAKLQSAQLQIQNIARFHRGASEIAADAVIAAPQTSLSFNAIFDTTDYVDLAYGGGGSSVSALQSSVGSVSGSLAVATASGTTVATYSLSEIKPDTYSWADIIAAEPDANESVDAHVNGGISVS